MGRIEARSVGPALGEQINPIAALVVEEWGMELFDARLASQLSLFARPETRLTEG